MTRARISAGACRLGFLGTGWIGCHRLRAVAASGLADVVAVCDPAPDAEEAALAAAPGARRMRWPEMLREGLDGVVIATPSALHAEQALAAIEAGVAVYCQKPLARTAAEAAQVVQAAEDRGVLLDVDLCYRRTEGMQRVKALVDAGELGRVTGLHLVFHNAYGPDKPWFTDPALSGGGCAMDLGIHLVDLALWLLGYPPVGDVTAALRRRGAPCEPGEVEDYAQVQLMAGVPVQLACSWWLHAGRDAVIGAEVYGTDGGAALHNVGGSFFDLRAERYRGTATEVLCVPPDAWGGRSIVAWAARVARGDGFDAAAWHLVDVARVLDRIYGR